MRDYMERTEQQEKVDIIWQQLCYWEMIANTLIHREFTSSYTAKFVIEKDRMYTENANRSSGDGIITPDNMEPNPKNPIIASFFRNIGWSDRLGSGVRNIFKYSKYYSGEEPEFVEGDVFRLIVPLNEDYSYDNVKNGDKKTAIKNGDKKTAIKNGDKKTAIKNGDKKTAIKNVEFMEEGKEYTIQDFCNLLNLKPFRTKELLKALTQDIEQIGNNKNRKYRLK
ncbi:predicted transcriptional regulator containing an HTH domain and an uncharacterized domain shared with the mammalian protein Schlafen [Lachnospiraceae bacterium CAG:25]|nr:predicted transcriptional regulator containing an HTH domain and an uncharacterized domain shared with the mammalian protein Schlafen [Lachnospiraceae bacterium CAG:25]